MGLLTQNIYSVITKVWLYFGAVNNSTQQEFSEDAGFTLDENAAEIIRPLLDPDEEILWAGQPDTSVHLSKNDYFLVPLSILVFVLGIMWATTITVFGWLFVVVGVYALFGRFFWKVHRKKVNYYAITEKRIIKLAGKKGKAQPFVEIQGIRMSPGSQGRGSIRFSDKPTYVAVYQNSGIEWISLIGAPDEIAFHDIQDVGPVHEMVRDLIYKAKGLDKPEDVSADHQGMRRKK
jgi:hypothetical protein